MSGFLKRLFSKQHCLIPDVAGGDWTPVPVSATAQAANVMGWLQERPRAIRVGGEPVRPRRHTIRRMYRALAGLPDDEGDTIRDERPPTFASNAVEREDPTTPDSRSVQHARAILAGREDPTLPHRRAASAFSHQPSPVLDSSSSSSKPRHVVEHAASRAGEDAFPADREAEEWIDVLKQYGEHLTEEELKIIKRQLA